MCGCGPVQQRHIIVIYSTLLLLLFILLLFHHLIEISVRVCVRVHAIIATWCTVYIYLFVRQQSAFIFILLYSFSLQHIDLDICRRCTQMDVFHRPSKGFTLPIRKKTDHLSRNCFAVQFYNAPNSTNFSVRTGKFYCIFHSMRQRQRIPLTQSTLQGSCLCVIDGIACNRKYTFIFHDTIQDISHSHSDRKPSAGTSLIQ